MGYNYKHILELSNEHEKLVWELSSYVVDKIKKIY